MTSHPTITEIKEALTRSGYLMEQRLGLILEQFGYFVTPNHEYEDPDTGKSREIDIHALTMLSVHRQWSDILTPTLLIACRNNYLPVVAFTNENLLRGVDEGVPIPKAGHPLAVYEDNETESVESFLRMGKFHHYYQARRLATQYCRITESRSGKKGAPVEYIADHGDLYEDLDSLIKAVQAEVAEYEEVTAEEKRMLGSGDKESDVNLVFINPVLVFSGELYECHQSQKGVTLRSANHIIFLRRVKSRTVKGEFFVDLVREAHFRRYLRLVERESEAARLRLRRHRPTLRRSVATYLRSHSDFPLALASTATEPQSSA